MLKITNFIIQFMSFMNSTKWLCVYIYIHTPKFVEDWPPGGVWKLATFAHETVKMCGNFYNKNYFRF